MLIILTVAGVYDHRPRRRKLAGELGRHYTPTDILQLVAWHLHRYQSSPARLSVVLCSAGAFESSLSARRNEIAPAWLDGLTCGPDDDRRLGQLACILHPLSKQKRVSLRVASA